MNTILNLLVAALLTFAASGANAQVSVNINIGCETRLANDDSGTPYPKGEGACVEWDKGTVDTSGYTTIDIRNDYRQTGGSSYYNTSYVGGYLGFIIGLTKSCPSYKYSKGFEVAVGRIALGKSLTTPEHNLVQATLSACRLSTDKTKK